MCVTPTARLHVLGAAPAVQDPGVRALTGPTNAAGGGDSGKGPCQNDLLPSYKLNGHNLPDKSCVADTAMQIRLA